MGARLVWEWKVAQVVWEWKVAQAGASWCYITVQEQTK